MAGRFSERYADRSTSEPVFPAALMLAKPSAVSIVGETVTWHSPTSLPELLALKANHPEARIVAGNTEVTYCIYVDRRKENGPRVGLGVSLIVVDPFRQVIYS